MSKFKDTYRIESTRLPEYDYSHGGYYFVTICTHNRLNLFGKIENGKMILNDAGKIVEKCINEIPDHFPNVTNDYYSIMPNHLHIIIIINEEYKHINEFVETIHELSLREKMTNRRKMLLPKIVGFLKMNASKQINIIHNTPGKPVWQRNYYEHIIRNDKSLYEIRKYIQNNPIEWEDDEYFAL